MSCPWAYLFVNGQVAFEHKWQIANRELEFQFFLFILLECKPSLLSFHLKFHHLLWFKIQKFILPLKMPFYYSPSIYLGFLAIQNLTNNFEVDCIHFSKGNSFSACLQTQICLYVHEYSMALIISLSKDFFQLYFM